MIYIIITIAVVALILFLIYRKSAGNASRLQKGSFATASTTEVARTGRRDREKLILPSKKLSRIRRPFVARRKLPCKVCKGDMFVAIGQLAYFHGDCRRIGRRTWGQFSLAGRRKMV